MPKKRRYNYSPLRAKKRNKRHWWNRLSIFRLNVVICVLAFTFFIGNLVMVNSITANGYDIEEIEQSLFELQTKNQNLSINLSDKQSIENVMTKLDNLGMVESGQVSYITAPNRAVARR